jgi:Cof subfamily protein (haloacid dehalogenase superfamily)
VKRPELVGLALDGTLIDRSLTVSPRTLAVLARARGLGVRLTIVTGRMFAAARPFAQAIGAMGPIVCYQGAAVYDATTGERLSHTPVASATALEIAQRALAEGLHVQLYADDRYYVQARTRHGDYYAELAQVDPIVVPSLATEFAGRDSTKVVIATDPHRANELMIELAAKYGDRAYVTRSQPEFVEVLNPRADKGAALALVATRLGIALERTLAVGDAWNDVPLLRAAGFGVAMGSAPPELRAVADAVVADVSGDGVAEAIERFVVAPQQTAAS